MAYVYHPVHPYIKALICVSTGGKQSFAIGTEMLHHQIPFVPHCHTARNIGHHQRVILSPAPKGESFRRQPQCLGLLFISGTGSIENVIGAGGGGDLPDQ